MDLEPYVDNLRSELAVAAEAGGAESRAIAERLAATLESATRLTLLNALSAAADEITRDLAPGSVDVRLRGLNPDFVVTSPVPEPPAQPQTTTEAPAAQPMAPSGADDGATARINFRVPEGLKNRIEEAAGREGLSVNAWLTRIASSALDGEATRTATPRTSMVVGQSFTGWVR
jgi:hypothetical protein